MNGRTFVLSLTPVLALLVSWGSPPAFGQFQSAIEGTVRDQSGAVIAAANVTATDSQLGVTRTTTSSTAGYFRLESIAASTYTVRIEASGFQNWEQKDLVVTVGQIRTLAPVLTIASATYQLTISAEQPVNLATPQTSSVIQGASLEQTPLPGQNIFHLLPLAPGLTGNGITSGDIFTTEYAININAAGLRQEQNGFDIDGVATNTPSRGGSTSITPSPAIVESMEVRTNDFDAQKGRNAGAITNVFTKSGANEYHGSIDYFFTDDRLTALTHFQSKLPPSTRNEVSGAMGGAIIKNKLFWFGSFDVLRSSVTQSGSVTVETQDFYNWVKANLSNTVAYPGPYAAAACFLRDRKQSRRADGQSDNREFLPATTRYPWWFGCSWQRELHQRLTKERTPREFPNRPLFEREKSHLRKRDSN